MPPERCAYLMTIALANKLEEVWISRHPYLFFVYVAQYMPSIRKWCDSSTLLLSCIFAAVTLMQFSYAHHACASLFRVGGGSDMTLARRSAYNMSNSREYVVIF